MTKESGPSLDIFKPLQYEWSGPYSVYHMFEAGHKLMPVDL